jgi:hypothetical protein
MKKQSLAFGLIFLGISTSASAEVKCQLAAKAISGEVQVYFSPEKYADGVSGSEKVFPIQCKATIPSKLDCGDDFGIDSMEDIANKMGENSYQINLSAHGDIITLSLYHWGHEQVSSAAFTDFSLKSFENGFPIKYRFQTKTPNKPQVEFTVTCTN